MWDRQILFGKEYLIQEVSCFLDLLKAGLWRDTKTPAEQSPLAKLRVL